MVNRKYEIGIEKENHIDIVEFSIPWINHRILILMDDSDYIVVCFGLRFSKYFGHNFETWIHPTVALYMIKIRLVNHWMATQWFEGLAFSVRTEDPGFCIHRSYGWALLNSSILWWNTCPVHPNFKWFFNSGRYVIWIALNNLDKSLNWSYYSPER